MEIRCHENYPMWIILVSNLVWLSIYFASAYILFGLGLIFAIPYIVYCFLMEIRLLKYGCANCYYYDKVCGFGKGKFSALFFRQ